MKIFKPTVESAIVLPTGSAPATSSGFAYIYAKTDGNIYLANEGGTESQIGGGGGGGGGFTFYTPTLNDAENTTSTIDLASITIPANTWEDGQVVYFDLGFSAYNQSGANRNPTVDFNGTGITGFTGLSGFWGQFTDENGWVRMAMVRNGTGVYTLSTVQSTTGNYTHPGDITVLRYNSFQFAATDLPYDSSVDFTVDITIKYSITFPIADPALWARPFWASGYKSETGASS